MANTERFNTLQKVVIARKAANKLRDISNLTSDERNLVDSAYAALIDVEDLLILEDIKDSVKDMESNSKKLGALTKEFEKSAARLKKVAKFIGDAAKALGVLADIVSKAAAAGI
jgi:vacuolar-type H+-ATPase subunit I/STV1